MAITEAEMPYSEMIKVAGTHTCGQCGGRLNVAWVGKGYILRCRYLSHNTINRHDKEHEEKIRQIKEIQGMDSKSLQVMPEAAMLQRIDMAKFPQDLTIADKRLLAQVAITYGFDPLMGEVTIYQGKPFVSIDGRYRKAQETGKLDGVQSRPATKQERADWEIPDGDYFYRAEVFVKGAGHPFTAWGRVFKSETAINKPGDAYKPVVKNPQRMAEKRAEAQALRKAFHIPLPSVEDIGVEEELRPCPPGVVESTGEIIEHEAKEPAPAKPPEPPQEAPKPATEVVKPPDGTMRMSRIELLAYVQREKKLRTDKEAIGFIVNVCHIEANRIDSEPGQVYEEVKQLLGK